ncbi:hypothetical protein [Acuticoccus sp. I52.16.1]|uniref:hypothetical protein n=1 Tax=Acuticoccus sp. I52.16.1 TaxID=2928472 RepID=UPI001FD4C195|nr:hypothetical protein [Acuticoccus sp. I52.16.1]UOM34647.1 hypothetical protein MRB58_00060 [Acuticoccus sp. I52.16.1]
MTMMMSFLRGTDLSQTMLSDLPRVAVLGLGRNGTVAAACLASAGHRVHAVDTDPARVTALNAGHAPVDESGLFPLIEGSLRNNRLHASTSVIDAVTSSDISLVSADLAATADGDLDCEPLLMLADAIGLALGLREEYHVVVVRTAVPPGLTMKELVPRIEAASGRRAGEDFGVAVIPAFLRPGRAVADFLEPIRTVIGALDHRSRSLALRVFATFDPNPTLTTVAAAEMVKQVDTAWRAVRSGFAADMARMCGRHDLSCSEILDLAGPGITPVSAEDLQAVRMVRRRSLGEDDDVPLPAAVAASAERQVSQTAAMIMSWRPRKVGILGLPLVDGALGESPVLALVAALHEAGAEVLIHDPAAPTATALGEAISHLTRSSPALRALPFMLEDMLRPAPEHVTAEADVILLARTCDAFQAAAYEASFAGGRPVVDARAFEMTRARRRIAA